MDQKGEGKSLHWPRLLNSLLFICLRRFKIWVSLKQSPVTAVDTTGSLRSLFETYAGWWYEVAGESFAAAPFQVTPAPMGRGGALTVAIKGPKLLWARPDAYEVIIHDSLGQVELILRVDQPLDLVTPALHASYLETGGWRPWPEFVEETIPFPTEVPSFDHLFAAADDAIWVRRFSFGDAAEEWLRFTLAPTSVANFRLSRRVRVMTATAEYAYGIWRDELDVEHIVRFRHDAL